MAIVKIIDLGEDCKNPMLIHNEIHYILRVNDSDNMSIGIRLYGGRKFILSSYEGIVYQFEAVRSVYHKNNTIQGRHFIVSFSYEYDHVGPFQAYLIANQIADFLGDEYQVLFGVHEDTYNLHIHFFINATNIYTGRMLNFDRRYISRLMNHIRTVFDSPYLWIGIKPIILLDNPMEY